LTKNYKILVVTSDKYINAIRPLGYLLNRYWPEYPEVVVGGFTPPNFTLPPKFRFHSIGKMSDYPIDRWSDGLIKFINDVGDDVFMLMLEDMWPIRPVYDKAVDMAHDYMVQFEYVARLDLTGDRLNSGGAALYGKLGHIDLIWSDPDSQYHLSMMPAFWRKSHLLRVLVPGETPWDVELRGTPRLSALRHECIVLGTNAWPYKNTLAFRGGETSHLLLNEIDGDDVTAMRELGLLDELE